MGFKDESGWKRRSAVVAITTTTAYDGNAVLVSNNRMAMAIEPEELIDFLSASSPLVKKTTLNPSQNAELVAKMVKMRMIKVAMDLLYWR